MKREHSERESFRLAFADRLAEARRKAGRRFDPPRKFTQADLAEACGVSNQAVAAWEAGTNEPPFYAVWQIAQLMGISPGWLAFGEGDPHEPSAHTPGVPVDQGRDAAAAIREERASRDATQRRR